MPKAKRAWAAWNYSCNKPKSNNSPHLQAATHYWMNPLQNVSKKSDYFVSLNTRDQINPSAIHHRLQYDHPLFDIAAMKAQKQLPELNRTSLHTYYCGSYFRYGFHEDAFKSAHDLCQHLLESDPWPQ